MSYDPRAVLVRALQSSAPFHVISLSRESRDDARLVSVDDEELNFRLAQAHTLEPQDAVTILFSTGPRTYTFLARVADVDGEHLWVPFPEELLSVDRRLRPRLAVTGPATAEFEDLDGTWELVDISPTGMRVRPAPDGELGTVFDTVLHAGEHRVVVRAELRHVHGEVAGFFFRGSVTRGRVFALPGLADLIAAITEG